MTRVRNGPGDVGPELAAELLERGRELKLRARGHSMFPLIRDGDLLTLEPLAAAPRAGEVVAAIRGCQLLIHRVLRTDEQGAVLQGDALLVPDGRFAIHGARAYAPDSSTSPLHDRVVGRVTLAVRDEQELGAWRLRGPIARAWTYLLPLLRAGRRACWLARSWFVVAH